MNRFIRLIKSLFSSSDDYADAQKLQMLRLEFKDRFYSFKALLQANNNALEQMASMEKALDDRDPFGMPFIKATATAATVDVYRMVRSLDDISPGKYRRLEQRFSDIQKKIVHALTIPESEEHSPLIIPFSDLRREHAPLVGSKIARLCEARNRLQLSVPDGFAITADAYRCFLSHNELQVEINRRFQMADFSSMSRLQTVCEGIEQLIMAAEIPDTLLTAIQDAYGALQNRIGGELKAALRSSAIGEDLARTSFAGQYLSRLNVGPDNLIQAYREIVACKYSLQAVVYRYNCGLRDEDIAMCVGCMEMIPATAGGVVYSRDPMAPHADHMIINASWGLPKLVVDGSAGCDQALVSRELPHPITDYRIEEKEHRISCNDGNGIRTQATEAELSGKPALKPEQGARLAHWALQLERHFGSAQDMEWAADESEQIHLLQCRPLRQMVPEERIHQEQEPDSHDNHLIVSGGVAVSSGAGWGPVFFIDSVADIPRFLPGSVLVTRLALPCWAPLLDRAAAIITERGGFAGHLGNVAREFGVPAIFGIPNARDLLRDVETVTVDAGNSRIFRGKITSLLTRSNARKNLIEGSPVFETLKSVSRHIVPLSLLDPDAVEFRPENCMTLHDITRFIHEKSVQEIFNFGREFRFTERTAKQLMVNVPMHWWVLNLDDGFSKEIRSRYVRLEEICCVAMHALWDGITAVPWDGPPRIDGRGLMSIMFQPPTNRTLSNGGRSGAADRSYFMVSRHFCSLTSRLGYHFTSVETIVSDEPDENYICFQYRGGAADIQRRFARVRFLGDILQENGFISKIREDTLIARLEKREQSVMIQKLHIIGYLIIHSRQLDMIMKNNASINHYRKKFQRDIKEIISSKHDANAGNIG